MFGENSNPVHFLDGKIVAQGRDEPVIAEERQMLYALGQMFIQKPVALRDEEETHGHPG